MKKIAIRIVQPLGFFAVALLPFSVCAMTEDDPVLAKFMIDQLESRNADENNPLVLEGQAWIGRDLNKLWLKTDVEQVDGETEELELQALYSRALAPFWNIQGGVRHDFKTEPGRSWAVIGVQGLAPYKFEVDVAAFIDEDGKAALRTSAEYEIMFTQRIVVTPEIEANFYAEDSLEYGEGSGLSDIQAGLRLRYHIRREFAPYVGINWQKQFGSTATFSKDAGEDIDQTQWVLGVRAWF